MDYIGNSLILALVCYPLVTALAWERGPFRMIERLRLLAPEGSELDHWISCSICMAPSAVAVALIAVFGYRIWCDCGLIPWSLLDAGIVGLLAWGWLWIFIRMTRFGAA